MRSCPACGATVPAGPAEPWRCECGSPLELASEPSLPARPPDRGGDSHGIEAAVELSSIEPTVTLGEGSVPLLEFPTLDATVALEYVSPTGSFKDRGAAAMLSRAAALDVDRVVEDSSGNAGLAVAAYAARASIEAEIYVPADAVSAKQRAIEATGAELVTIDGSREDVATACQARADDPAVWYASHAWAPSFTVGTATAAYDWCFTRDWHPPDAVVLPVGHGTLLLGLYRGFSHLHEAGWIDHLPALYAVQAAGVAPIVDRTGGSTAGENTVADGVQIAAPVHEEQVVEAISDTGGGAVAIDEAATRTWWNRLHRAGLLIEPTSALGPAGLSRLRDEGSIDPLADVIVPLTGRARHC